MDKSEFIFDGCDFQDVCPRHASTRDIVKCLKLDVNFITACNILRLRGGRDQTLDIKKTKEKEEGEKVTGTKMKPLTEVG